MDSIERAVAPSVRSGASTRPTARNASTADDRQHRQRDRQGDLHGLGDLRALVLEVGGDHERPLALAVVVDRHRDVARALDVAAGDPVDLAQLAHAVEQLGARPEVGVGAVRRLADERERRLALVRDVAHEEVVEQPPHVGGARLLGQAPELRDLLREARLDAVVDAGEQDLAQRERRDDRRERQQRDHVSTMRVRAEDLIRIVERVVVVVVLGRRECRRRRRGGALAELDLGHRRRVARAGEQRRRRAPSPRRARARTGAGSTGACAPP